MGIDVKFKKKDIEKLIEDGNDRELCFLMLFEVYEEDAFSNLVIKKADRIAASYNKSLDFVRAMLYGTLTYSFTIDFLVRHITKEVPEEMDPVSRTLIRMAVWQLQFGNNIPEYAVCDSSVEIAKKYNAKAAGYVNAVLRKYCGAPEAKKYLEQYKPGIRVSLKPEIYGILKKDYGKSRAFEIGEAFLRPAPVTIRFNPDRVSGKELEASLKRDGINCTGSSFMPDCLAVEGGIKGLEQSEAFARYGVFVQGEGAQLASVVADPHEGDRILDCCAAPGGKSTHMAELAHDKCEIVAVDINESRTELIEENCERIGIKSVSVKCMDATKLSKDKDSRKSYDIVLCDVPCSGLGLIARKPDIRTKLTFDGVESLLSVQAEILDNASKMVRPGGALVYCTCTLNSAENGARIADFLEEHKNFHTVSIERFMPEKLNVDDERLKELQNGMITLLPDTDSCDGFFICRMERSADV